MGRLDKIEEWLDDHLLIVCAVTLIVLLALLGLACFFNDSHDDRPSWANDMAGQLDKNGGRVWVYNEGASGYSTRIDYIVDAKDDVYADSHGIVVKGSGGITVFPYDKIWGIYTTGGLA